ncbi:TPA: hypothetical protein ACX6O4_000482 [Photobacterium damselae]|uniref:hypothetical protein n=2 Tax=Photobacterium damselae TaxID=38293 RepID=UPI00370C179F|nr:hypothetical protein [Photobacterium damselae]
MKKKNKKQSTRSMFVVETDVSKYDYKDNRAMKPYCIDCKDHPEYPMSVAFQEVDKVKLSKNRSIEYFVPNNIALLLSSSRKALISAETMYKEVFLKYDEQKNEIKKEILWKNCSLVSDYIELIQTSIVFGYTALEAFANISIPDGYIYISKPNNKGIKEQLDKFAIERWLRLQDKLDIVLPDIYQAHKLSTKSYWAHFLLLEEHRNNIIHQKSIDKTSFFFEYFKPKIFDVLKVPEKIVRFFHDENIMKNTSGAQANLMWPWLKGAMSYPIMTQPNEILSWTIDIDQPSVKKRLTEDQRMLLKETSKTTEC